MLWFALQSLFLIAGAFLLGLLVGWLVWGRRTTSERIVVVHGDAAAPLRLERPASGPDRRPAQSVLSPGSVSGSRSVSGTGATSGTASGSASGTASGSASGTGSTSGPVSEPRPGPWPGQTVQAVPLGQQTTASPGQQERPGQAAGPSPLAVTPTPVAPAVQQDDLRRIEGIGPRVAAALHADGVHRYADLAACDDARLRRIMREASLRTPPSLPSWPHQAALLVAGDEAGFAAVAARVARAARTAPRHRATGTG